MPVVRGPVRGVESGSAEVGVRVRVVVRVRRVARGSILGVVAVGFAGEWREGAELMAVVLDDILARDDGAVQLRMHRCR
jgi:hypothetical protein